MCSCADKPGAWLVADLKGKCKCPKPARAQASSTPTAAAEAPPAKSQFADVAKWTLIGVLSTLAVDAVRSHKRTTAPRSADRKAAEIAEESLAKHDVRARRRLRREFVKLIGKSKLSHDAKETLYTTIGATT